jgi:hypothetical protein
VTVPFSLIVDDGSPVSISYWTHPSARWPWLFANSFTERFGDVCLDHGVRGKFTVMPMPAGLGRIDRDLKGVPPPHLRGFLRIVRRKIAPNFDITPEFLTHGPAVDIATGRFKHVYEDVFADGASVAEMTDYFAHAMRILQGAGLHPNGVTSPWMAGIKNEKRYAEAVARATWRVSRRKLGWYFLHIFSRGRPRWPQVTWRSRKAGLAAVMVPANTTDPFWRTQDARSARAARRAGDEGADLMLSADGRSGRVVEVVSAGCPVILLTHWQSLYSRGRCAGLGGLDRLFGRIDKTFPGQVRWLRCSQLARMALDRSAGAT